MYTIEEGRLAVRVARNSIEATVRGKPMDTFDFPPSFEKKAGVFVTINKHPSGDLRGCIGYYAPYYPLREALIRSAESATRDPRFLPLTVEELDRIVVEVSLLTPPELIEVSNPEEYVEHIQIGRDGLVASKGPYKGLLLPQVPVENNWGELEFLSYTCMKAGLPADAWMNPDTEIYKFQAEIFEEVEPRGEVHRRKLGESHEGD